MLGFANAEADCLKCIIRFDVGKELSELFERIGLELIEERIHLECRRIGGENTESEIIPFTLLARA